MQYYYFSSMFNTIKRCVYKCVKFRMARYPIFIYTSTIAFVLVTLDSNLIQSHTCDISSETELQILSEGLWRNATGISMNCSQVRILPFRIEDTYYGSALNLKIFEITITDSNLNNIVRNAFASFENLLILKIEKVGLRSIYRDSFSNIKELQELYLQKNLLSEIHRGDFSQLRNLEILDLSSNMIHYVESGSFRGLVFLKALNLSKNKIKTLHNVTFSALWNLRYLDLSHNELKGDFSLFNNLFKLVYLNISYNRIFHLEKGGFKDLKNLEVLDLADNSIESFTVGSLTGLENLTHFNMSNNKLFSLSCLTLYALQNLEQLQLDHNRLTFLNVNEILNCLPKLNDVSLEENNWECGLLLKNLQDFRSSRINVRFGSSFQFENIYGIRCTKRPDFSYNIQQKQDLLSSLNNPNANIPSIPYTSVVDNLKTIINEIFHNSAVLEKLSDNDSNTLLSKILFMEDLLKEMLERSKTTNTLLQSILQDKSGENTLEGRQFYSSEPESNFIQNSSHHNESSQLHEQNSNNLIILENTKVLTEAVDESSVDENEENSTSKMLIIRVKNKVTEPLPISQPSTNNGNASLLQNTIRTPHHHDSSESIVHPQFDNLLSEDYNESYQLYFVITFSSMALLASLIIIVVISVKVYIRFKTRRKINCQNI